MRVAILLGALFIASALSPEVEMLSEKTADGLAFIVLLLFIQDWIEVLK